MRAEIVTIGTELITGAAVDTNSAWISRHLIGAGAAVSRHTTVSDDLDGMIDAIGEAAGRADLLVVTGGLGPTPDDLTREALAALTGQPLEEDAAALAGVQSFFDRIQRPMQESNRRQATFPRGATPLLNPWGTAPAIRLMHRGCTIFALPGVPREMQALFDRDVRPFVTSRTPGGTDVRVLRTFGTGESNVAEQIRDLMAADRNPAVGTTASEGVISVRIFARGADTAAATRLADADEAAVRSRLGSLIFGSGETTLAAAVGALLQHRGATVSSAESCTGGMVGKLLTDTPGSSGYYVGGFVCYSNARKVADLGVDAGLIENHGAVSAEVAEAMALGCRSAAGSDYAIALTGVAGPDGGTGDKPVGLVYASVAGPDNCVVRELHYIAEMGRAAIRERASKTALNMLRRMLID